MTFRTAVAAPFKHTRKSGMKASELVYYYAFDRKWMHKEEAEIFIKRAEESHLLKQENGVYSPLFNVADVAIPIGFKPTSAVFNHHDPSQELISRIARARDVEETEIVAEMNRIIQERFDGNLLPPAALLLLAKQANIPFDDLSTPLQDSLKKG